MNIAFAYGDDHAAAGLELFEESGWDLGGGCGDDHFVEGSIGRQAFITVAVEEFNSRVFFKIGELLVGLEELLLSFDGN